MSVPCGAHRRSFLLPIPFVCSFSMNFSCMQICLANGMKWKENWDGKGGKKVNKKKNKLLCWKLCFIRFYALCVVIYLHSAWLRVLLWLCILKITKKAAKKNKNLRGGTERACMGGVMLHIQYIYLMQECINISPAFSCSFLVFLLLCLWFIFRSFYYLKMLWLSWGIVDERSRVS